jgi:hypothetical protein
MSANLPVVGAPEQVPRVLSAPRTDRNTADVHSYRSARVARLAAAISAEREQLELLCAEAGPKMLTPERRESVVQFLNQAEAHVKQGVDHIDAGWRALHSAQRLMVVARPQNELLALAVSAEAEARSKLRDWRLATAKQLFSTVQPAEWLKAGRPLKPEELGTLRSVVEKTLELLQEESANQYYRMELVTRQIKTVISSLALLLLAVLAMSAYLESEHAYAFTRLLAVMMAGALGGMASAAFQLSRLGAVKIPETLMDGHITAGRPVIAAASALFVYAVLHSGLLGSEIEGLPASRTYIFAFVAGFSESFVLGLVTKFTGTSGGSSRAEDKGANA